ncbi:DUF2726 domain-containing protein (plasmid) [Edwardsiella tarda]|uniref:DUF2726 domain-containing protein n=1 Tax=Edwardsiella tarda TaxID=636 RepID=UPI0024443948|nr:DUF2726 domain-containing protein [Edwardsiella tarda]WGE30935.1 DUF2726 domain-containing protein [Edwardsiella tarda]
MLFIFLGLALFILLFIIWLSAQGGKRDHPLWSAFLAAGIKPKESDRLLCQQCSFTAKPQLMTAREYAFFSALSPATGAHHWYFCPQVRVADIVDVSSAWKKGSRPWWCLFRLISQWHCDVVVIERKTGRIIAAIELDDATHQQVKRIRRDIVLNEIFRQAQIPLWRGDDPEALIQQVHHYLQARTTAR